MDFEKLLEMQKQNEDQGTKAVTERFPSVPHEMPTGLAKFDTRAVMADLKALESKGTALINEAEALIIKTPEQNMEAVNISGKLQELTKQVKKICEDRLAPHKKLIAEVNGPKKRITEAADKAKSIINQKIFQFGKQEVIDQAKQQKVIDEATEKLQESLKEQAKELGIKAPTVAPIKAPKPVTIFRGDSGASVYTQKKLKCEIVDADKVPFALKDKNGEERFRLCLPSQTLLNQAVKMGIREIPGCRIFEDETPVTKSA